MQKYKGNRIGDNSNKIKKKKNQEAEKQVLTELGVKKAES